MKNPRIPTILSASAGLAMIAPVLMAQTVLNPDFDPPDEDVSDNPAPGYGPINDWADPGGVGVGVNPSDGGSAPFLNGLSPHSGTHVAFLQGTRTISQAVSGYDPSKLYTVTYFVNERGVAGDSATSTSVSLDGGTSSYVQSDNIIQTDAFRRIVSGPLAVSGASSSLEISSTGVAGDNTLLVDTVSVTRAVPTVPDGGFENPVQPDTDAGTRYKLANGGGGGSLVGSAWDFGAFPSGISRNGSAFSSVADTAPEGSQAGLLRSTSSFSTTVDGFEAGVTYTLSFEATGRAGVSLGPNEIQIELGGVTLEFATATSITPATGSWATFTTDEFTTAGGSLELEFIGLTGGDKSSFIDDIRFNFVAEASTPTGELKITSITKSGTTVTVEFEGEDGESYDLNKSTALDFTTPDIQDSVTLSGTTTGTLEDTGATEDRAFYRVEQQ